MKRNQFIFIMTDTQRKDMINAFNDKFEMHTPNLDRLVKEGVSFDHAYTAQPVCGPARSTIFTGTYPHTNGMIGNSMNLGQGVKTIGERLSEANIHCGYIGKWHLDGGDYFGDGICPKGWDENYWFDMRNYLMEMSDAERLRSRKFESCFDENGVDESFTYAHKCTNKAIEFINKHKNEDFLLVLSYDEPHDPSLAPKKFFEPFKNKNVFKKENGNADINSLPRHIRLWAENTKEVFEDSKGFGLAGCNSFVDYEIGRVLEVINSDLWDPTIMYTSDHGASMGSHKIEGKGAAMYEEITNIPLIINSPHCRNSCTRRDIVSHIDITPTILEFFNIKKPEALYGESIFSKGTLRQEDKVNKAFIEFNRYEVDHDGFGGYQPVRCIVKDQFKLIISMHSDDELYNLTSDPEEMNNLINSNEYMEIRNKFHKELMEWMDETRDPYRGYCWEERPWQKNFKGSWNNHGMTRQKKTEPNEVKQLDYDTGLEISGFSRLKKSY
ncbi:MAG: sulfatase-like hydrolase/transferase [Lachnospirales bacterium]